MLRERDRPRKRSSGRDPPREIRRRRSVRRDRSRNASSVDRTVAPRDARALWTLPLRRRSGQPRRHAPARPSTSSGRGCPLHRLRLENPSGFPQCPQRLPLRFNFFEEREKKKKLFLTHSAAHAVRRARMRMRMGGAAPRSSAARRARRRELSTRFSSERRRVRRTERRKTRW
jgi:hypothetical protein